MAEFLQPQRVPLGYFTSPQGKRVEVMITLEWFKVLSALFKQVNANTDASGSTEAEDFGPLENLFPAIAEGLDNEPADLVSIHLLALPEGLQALEAAPGLHELQAEVAALRREVEILKEAPLP